MRPDALSAAAASVVCLALLLLGADLSPGSGKGVNPHAFMEDPEKCTDCHGEKPDAGKDDYTTVSFSEQIVTLCAGCHEDAHYREEHPVEIKPESEIPEELHLDNYYTMTCATCHDPHGEFEADVRFVPPDFLDLVDSLLRRQTRFPTYFLRKSNIGGELCLSCHLQGVGTGEEVEFSTELLPQFVGSATCSECHLHIYEEWGRTLHATNFQDASIDPTVILAEFDGDEPFPRQDVIYTVGSHWTQRYIFEGKRGLMVHPEQWSLIAKKWVTGGSFSRPWLRYCSGCHTTALNPFDGTFIEMGTGCEGCHGPGLSHSETTDQFDIVNPALLAPSRRDMICEACHTSGHDRSGRFRYPVGFRPGEDLLSFFRGLVPKAGQDAESFTGDGSYEDRHRQFEYWAGRINVMQGLSCDICTTHNRPSSEEIQPETEYILTPDEMCGSCHEDIIKDLQTHADHTLEQAGCLDCHPPMVTADGEAYSVHDHKFQFGKPPRWMVDGEDPCERCHPGAGLGKDGPGAM